MSCDNVKKLIWLIHHIFLVPSKRDVPSKRITVDKFNNNCYKTILEIAK